MTAAERLRVLVVDDSAFARKVLREALSRHPGIEVVDVARDGLEALEKIAALEPDVITVDLMMPNLDGVGLLRELALLANPPRSVVVSMSDLDSERVVEALSLGAVAIVKKPTALATEQLYELAGELTRAVLAAFAARVRPAVVLKAREAAPVQLLTSSLKLLALGTSTGGPQALSAVLAGLPGGLPMPVVMGLHIPVEYTEALARRLDSVSALTVVEAYDGIELKPGTAVLAKGGNHLIIEARDGGLYGRVRREPEAIYFPSIDLLFQSASRAVGPHLLGVVMTGMGDDGLEGARTITKAGGRVLTESESSCVVFGMPRAVQEAGLSAGRFPLEALAGAIVARL